LSAAYRRRLAKVFCLPAAGIQVPGPQGGAGPVLIEFKGTIVTGGIKGLIGGDVRGTALFPDDLTDQIKGGFEDW